MRLLLFLLILLVPGWLHAQTIEYQDLLVHNARTVVSDGSSIPVDRANTVTIEVTVAGTAEVLFRMSGPARTAWQSLACVPSGSTGFVTSTTSSGLFTCNVAGAEAVSARVDTCTGCTVSASIRRTTASVGGGGGGGGTQGLSSVGAIDRTYGEATSQATGIRIGSDAAGVYANFHYNAVTGIQMTCEVAGVLDDCDKVIKLLSGKKFKITDASGNAMLNFDSNGATPLLQYALGTLKARKSAWFSAGDLSGDGTQCPALSTDVQINSGPIIPTFICTDNDSATLYGSTRMPDSWDGGVITFTHSYIQTAANTGALNGDIAAQCRGNGEAPSSTWGTEVAIDDAAVTGSNNNDMTTSADVTPAGTCAAGDMLYFRYQLDATGTTTTITSLHHVGFMMEYAVSSLSD